PEVRLAFGQFDVELAHNLVHEYGAGGTVAVRVADADRHASLRCAVLHRQVQIPLVHRGELARHRLRLFLLVALYDVIDVDVPPPALLLVDDLNCRGLALEFGHVPRAPDEVLAAAGFVVRAGRGAHDLPADDEV